MSSTKLRWTQGVMASLAALVFAGGVSGTALARPEGDGPPSPSVRETAQLKVSSSLRKCYIPQSIVANGQTGLPSSVPAELRGEGFKARSRVSQVTPTGPFAAAVASTSWIDKTGKMQVRAVLTPTGKGLKKPLYVKGQVDQNMSGPNGSFSSYRSRGDLTEVKAIRFTKKRSLCLSFAADPVDLPTIQFAYAKTGEKSFNTGSDSSYTAVPVPSADVTALPDPQQRKLWEEATVTNKHELARLAVKAARGSIH